MALPHPVTFVHRHLARFPEIVAGDVPSPDALAPRLVQARDVWIIQTYAVLRRRGLDVRIAEAFAPGGIHVIHRDHLRTRDAPWNSFVVAIQADRDPVFICDLQIVQSPASVHGATDLFVPHWPQPGLRPRDPERGARVETVAFFGRERNLAARLRDPVFRRALEEDGVRLEIRERDWQDYRDVDVVLAVRDGRPSFLAAKPASKLVNAWHAGCPAVVGREPAYRALRRSDLDCLEASSPEEVRAAVARLRSEPELYQAMVVNGHERAKELSRERVAEAWEALLSGPVAEAYEAWRRGPALLRAPVRMGRFAARSFRRRLHGRRYRR